MEKGEILQEIKKAEEKASRIIAEAEAKYKKNLVDLETEMELLLEKKKQDLDLEIDAELKTEADRLTVEKQKAISEGTRGIEKIREGAIDNKAKAIDFVIEKFMRYIDALERKND
jgi:vacuolar-type H+-ATPase subunit H